MLVEEESAIADLEAIELAHAFDVRKSLGEFGVNIGLACLQINKHLIHFVKSSNLSLLIIHNIFLLFLDVIHCGLDLGCQVLL